MKRNNELSLKTVAIIEILGGVSGLIILSDLLIKTAEITGVILFIFLIGYALFALSIVAGKSLGFDTKRKRIYSYLNLALQIVQLSTLKFKFCYSIGPSILFGKKEENVFFETLFLPTFNMAIHSQSGNYFMINLLPILLIFLICKNQKSLK